MVLVELTSLDLSDLPMEAFRAHLRLGTGFADDAIQDEVLEGYIRAALAAIEARLGKVLLAREYRLELTAWADRARQALPIAPISAVTGVTVLDRAGAGAVADPELYTLERDAHRPVLAASGAGLPAIASGGSAEITFEAGFGPSWGDVPPDLRQAVFLLAAHYYENRRDTSGSSGLMPFGVMMLLEPHRNIRTLGTRA
jgi:uncharacterized phiE125 gp8 family phage protein